MVLSLGYTPESFSSTIIHSTGYVIGQCPGVGYFGRSPGMLSVASSENFSFKDFLLSGQAEWPQPMAFQATLQLYPPFLISTGASHPCAYDF